MAEGVPYAVIEDGFLRSLGLGRQGDASLSLVVDRRGIYFDARTPSELELMIEEGTGLDAPALLDLADRAIAFMLEHRLSKYNDGAWRGPVLSGSAARRVLVVDQVRDDASVLYGMERPFDLAAMVRSARTENPDADVYVKLHPETIAGLRKGGASSVSLPNDVYLISENINPHFLLEPFDKVYVATSLLGFEALLMGKQVVCFGMPFYAGWGLTDDRMRCARRTAKRSVREVFAAAYIRYSRYVDPHAGERCDILRALEILKRQVDHMRRRERNLFCFGIRHWKRYNVLPYLQSRHNRVVFVRSVKQAIAEGIQRGDEVVVWGSREPEGLEQLLAITGTDLLRMEDGFLRSVGLGSDFARPSSLVLDRDGIYFDPHKPSRLENILQDGEFDAGLIESASRLRKKLLAARLSKYNHQHSSIEEWPAVERRRVLFIPGQVGDDASVIKGCIDIADNTALIEEVRSNNPDAFIVYKPHPDVVSGNRRGSVPSDVLARCCDLVIEKATIADCLERADEVHTMTSLVGFEALMRELPVHVYGRPFYAGWGLTHDRHPIGRRTARRSIDELVAAALLLYPEYYDWDCGLFCDAETIVEKLAEQRRALDASGALKKLDPGYIERQVRKMILIIKGMANA